MSAPSRPPQARVALVTGASRGIGRAIAQRLAAQGVAVVVQASARSEAGLRETCARIETAGGQAAWVSADLAEPGARAGLVARAARHFGTVDMLVNNAAAITSYAPPSRMDHADRARMFEVNFHAPADLAQQALPAMRENGWGRVLNLGSEMASQPSPPYPGSAKMIHALALYGASKAALERYTRGLAAELDGSGIGVNALAPHRIALTEGAREVARQMAATHPDWIEPVEMMAEAAWLLLCGTLSGEVLSSRELLRRLHAPLHALDGVTVIGDCETFARVD